MQGGGYQPPGGGGPPGGYGGPANPLAPTMMGGPEASPFAQQQQPPSQQQQPSPYTQPSGGYGPPPGAPPGPAYGQAPPGFGGAPASFGAPQGGFGSPGMAMPAMPQFGQYEFNEYENSVLAKTAGRAKLWGIIAFVYGALNVVSTCGAFARPDMLINFPQGIVGIVVGIMFLGVGNSLASVTTTQGNDIGHLMQGMEKLSNAFLIQVIATLVGVGLAILIFILVAIFAAAMVATS